MNVLEEVCECGDWRSSHQGDGPCAVCCQSSAPWDGCEAFRYWRSEWRELFLEEVAEQEGRS